MAGVTAKIDTSQFDRKLKAADMKLKQNIVKQLRSIGTMTASKLRVGMPKDSGMMRQNTSPIHATISDLTETIMMPTKYTTFMDKGTKPFWPPPGVLIKGGWVTRHRSKFPQKWKDGSKVTPEGIDFVVRRAIARRGIRGRHFINPALSDAHSQANRMMTEAVKGIWE